MNGCIYRSADNICKFWSKDGIESYCDSYSCEKKTQSNADRIRSISDEELAEWLAILTDCVNCPCRDPHDQCDTVDGSCKKQWLNWLKEEAKGDT